MLRRKWGARRLLPREPGWGAAGEWRSVVFESACTPGGRRPVSSEHSLSSSRIGYLTSARALSSCPGVSHDPCAGWKRISDMRQNERRIEFTRIGDAVRTSGQLTREPNVFASLQPIFIVSRQRKFLLKWWH